MLVSTRLFWNLASALATLGFDSDAVLRLCGLTWKDLEERDGDDRRLPLDRLHGFWSAAVAVTGDQSIGVRVGALSRIEGFGVLGHIARSSATLGDALLKTARYIRLLNAATGLSLLVEGDHALLWYRSLVQDRPHPAGGDTVLTSLLVLSRQLAGKQIMPSESRFAHAAPPNEAAFHEVFGDSAKFDCLEYGLVFRPDILTLPITTFDSELGERLTQQASELVDALPAAGSFSRRVRALLNAELRGGNPLSENIAAQLGVHPKTLTRRLKDEGTSHRELLDTLRRELAERYVSTADLNVSEVAFLLGFSDTSAFNKAFKRWFGLAPVAFRRSLQS